MNTSLLCDSVFIIEFLVFLYVKLFSMTTQRILIAIFLVLSIHSCEKDNTDPVSLAVQKPSEVMETSFQLNWTVSNHNFQSITIDLSLDRNLEAIEESITISDATQKSCSFTGKKGATKYYYRISLIMDGKTLMASDMYGVETAYEAQGVTLVTSDDKNLNGSLTFLKSNAETRPGIILMHAMGVWVNPWIDSPLLKRLVSEGYVCFTFFFRGHGSSSSIDGDVMSLFEDKSLIASDLDAAISFMSDNELVTRNSLGLIGASLGGIMALAGNGYDQVITSVSLSAPADGVYEIFPNMTLSSVYYLVGELDIRPEMNSDLPRDARMLYNSSEAPKKLTIVEGTSDHGTELLSKDDLIESIKEWILEMLPIN